MPTRPTIDALDRPGGPGRWMPSHKEELLARLRRGDLSLEDALRRYRLTLEEVESWKRRYRAGGRPALRQTALQRPLPGL